MIDNQTLYAVLGVSTPLGFLSMLAYFYFLQQFRRNEQSVREVIEGEGLFNASHVLKILETFKDDSTRLQALAILTNHDQTKAKDLLEKLKTINIIQLHEMSTTHCKQTAGWSTLFFSPWP